MKRLGLLFALAVLLGLPLAASAQPVITNADVFVDTNGDGVAGPNATTTLYAPTTFDVWLDSKAYAFTVFQVWLDIGDPGSLYFSRSTTVGDSNIVTLTNTLAGGTFFPLDNFSSAEAIGFGGSGYPNLSGAKRIATMTTKALRVAPSFSACITPLVDFSMAPYCILQNGATYSTFADGAHPAACYTISSGTAAELTSWGGIKGLYR